MIMRWHDMNYGLQLEELCRYLEFTWTDNNISGQVERIWADIAGFVSHNSVESLAK